MSSLIKLFIEFQLNLIFASFLFNEVNMQLSDVKKMTETLFT